MVWSGLRLWIHGVRSMIRVTVGLPPDQATSGRTNIASRSGSLVRADRIGPSSVTSWECTTAMYRLMPSTFSSMTTSARSRPICGIASGALSILPTSAGRSSRSTAAASASSTTSPVSGAVGPAGTATVVVVLVVVVVVGGLGDLVVAAGQREHDPSDHEQREHDAAGDQPLTSAASGLAGRPGGVAVHDRHVLVTRRILTRQVVLTTHRCSLAVAGRRERRTDATGPRSA